MKTLKVIGFWFLSWTWGIIMTLLGAIIGLALMITGHKPHRFRYLIYFEVGENWGGFECGCFFVCNKNASLHTKQHESGHGIQNIIFGEKYRKLPPYDSMWFEGLATKWGEKYFKENA